MASANGILIKLYATTAARDNTTPPTTTQHQQTTERRLPQRVDYDALFEIKPKKTEEDWYTTLTAMSLDDEELPLTAHRRRGQAQQEQGAGAEAKPQQQQQAAAAAAADKDEHQQQQMDTSDKVPLLKSKKRSRHALKMSAVPM